MFSLCTPNARFFEDYKKNEHKEVVVDEFLGADAARKCVVESLVRQTAVLWAVVFLKFEILITCMCVCVGVGVGVSVLMGANAARIA